MFYIEEFDLKDNVNEEEFMDAWNDLTNWWHRSVDTIRLVHFSARTFSLGPGPKYLAIWQAPNFAAMDGWKQTLTNDPEGTAFEKRFSSMVTNVHAKVMGDLLQK